MNSAPHQLSQFATASQLLTSGKMVERMHCSFYLRKGTAFVPTMAKTEAGYWMGIEPVDVQKVETVEALERLLLVAIAEAIRSSRRPHARISRDP